MVLTAWSAGYHFDALTCPPAHLPSPHSKHWREDRLPCLRPTEEQMLPVFERWARVVALAEVRGAGLDLCMLSACHCQKMGDIAHHFQWRSLRFEDTLAMVPHYSCTALSLPTALPTAGCTAGAGCRAGPLPRLLRAGDCHD